jgi:LysM repeat protein
MVDEATQHLKETLSSPEMQTITLNAPNRAWQITWAEMGQGYDYTGMAKAAYRAGREARSSAPREIWNSLRLRLRSQGYTVTTRVTPAQPEMIKDVLQSIADALYRPPLDAQLLLNPNGVVAIPGQDGQALDLTASASTIEDALTQGADSIDLVIVPLSPQLAEPEPAASEARALLAAPFVLIADDPLTYYYAEFPAAPAQVAGWLRPIRASQCEYTCKAAPCGAGCQAVLYLEVQVDPVRAWLTDIAPQVGTTRTLDIAETLTRTLSALRAGEHQAWASFRHPAYTYTVQPGDAFFDIAYSYGFPQWQLERANPTVDPGMIDVGQVLTIPSIDVLFPHPLVRGKRIEIDLPTQRLYGYEWDYETLGGGTTTEVVTTNLATSLTPVFTLAVSSGMSSTPTIAGQFQVLFKEPSAYAQRWALDMPYFMAIYEEREGFHNGIHELPITSYGRQLSPLVLGWPASYGCIIVDVGDAEMLYNWAPVGTLVRIHGVAPGTPTWQETLGDIAPPVQPEE